MEFKQLQSFVAVVQYKSFTKAAEHLFLSQPTISAHLRQLEEELGQQLLLRTTKSIEVTRKGQEVYNYARSILDLRERLIDTCAHQTQKIIHVGASTIPSAYILPELLPEFGQEFPDTYFSIHQGDSQSILAGLKEWLFDVGLVGMPVEEENIACIPFFEDQMVMITPVNQHFLDLRQQPGCHLAALLKEPIIMREQGSGSKKTADRFLEGMGVSDRDLTIVARINDQEAIKNLVANGLGVSIISQLAARNFLSERRILSFDLPEGAASRSLYLIYRKDDVLKPYIQKFVRFLMQKNRKNGGW